MSQPNGHEPLRHHRGVVEACRDKSVAHGVSVPAIEPNEAAVQTPQGRRVLRETLQHLGGHADRNRVKALDLRSASAATRAGASSIVISHSHSTARCAVPDGWSTKTRQSLLQPRVHAFRHGARQPPNADTLTADEALRQRPLSCSHRPQRGGRSDVKGSRRRGRSRRRPVGPDMKEGSAAGTLSSCCWHIPSMPRRPSLPTLRLSGIHSQECKRYLHSLWRNQCPCCRSCSIRAAIGKTPRSCLGLEHSRWLTQECSADSRHLAAFPIGNPRCNRLFRQDRRFGRIPNRPRLHFRPSLRHHQSRWA